MDRKHRYERRYGTANVEGQLYERELISWCLLRGKIKNMSFHLASNMLEGYDFDDLVFRYNFENADGSLQNRVSFIQLKHTTKDLQISWNGLLTSKEFMLSRYLSSFMKIKQHFVEATDHPIFSINNWRHNYELIIYTNVVLHDKNMKQFNKIFTRREDVLDMNQNYYYTLVKNEKLVNSLKESFDFKRIIDVLASKFPNCKSIEWTISEYNHILEKDVIEMINKKEGKLRTKLFTDEKLKPFKDALFETLVKKTGIPLGELKDKIKSWPIQLPDGFSERTSYKQFPLPDKYIDKKEIEDFLDKLKLYFGQPDREELENKIKEQLALKLYINGRDIDSAYARLITNAEKYWLNKNRNVFYLTETNKYLEDAKKALLWYNVRPPSDLFTGRRHDLDILHKQMIRGSGNTAIVSRITIVSGLGGIGKTDLVRKYIQKKSDDYDNNIIWIDAESEKTITETLKHLYMEKLNKKLTYDDGTEKDICSIIEDICNFFSNKKNLIVFDNANIEKDFKKFLPNCPKNTNTYILITSRNQEWGRGISVINLDILGLKDAMNLVKKGLSMSNDSEDMIKNLVQTLHRFPLAIQQAIAYIYNQRKTDTSYNIKNYLDEYDKEHVQSCTFHGLDNNYTKTTYTTWEITTQKIKSRGVYGEIALEILNCLAYLSPNYIAKDMLLPLTKDNRDLLNKAIRLLVQYSMVNIQYNQNVLRINRLVQVVIRLKIENQGKERLILDQVQSLLDKYCLSMYREEEERRNIHFNPIGGNNLNFKQCCAGLGFDPKYHNCQCHQMEVDNHYAKFGIERKSSSPNRAEIPSILLFIGAQLVGAAAISLIYCHFFREDKKSKKVQRKDASDFQ